MALQEQSTLIAKVSPQITTDPWGHQHLYTLWSVYCQAALLGLCSHSWCFHWKNPLWIRCRDLRQYPRISAADFAAVYGRGLTQLNGANLCPVFPTWILTCNLFGKCASKWHVTYYFHRVDFISASGKISAIVYSMIPINMDSQQNAHGFCIEIHITIHSLNIPLQSENSYK